MLAALVQVVLLAAPACATPDVAGSTLRAGYLPASDEATFARCSADPDYLFQNRGSEVTRSFLLELNAPLRDRASFERAVHQLAVAVNGLWIGISPRHGEGAPTLGPCADDLLRFLLVDPARGELQRAGAGPAGGLAMLALLRALGHEDEAIWAPRDTRSPPVSAVISRVLAGGAVDGSTVGPGDDQAVEMLRVGNVVEVRTPAGTDWIFVASRPQAAAEGGGKRWRFMGVHVAVVERAGGRGVPGALLIRTARMRAWFDARRWRFELASPCGRGPEGTLGRYYDTWEVLREEAYPLPPLLPIGALLPDLPMSGDWSPWPDLFQKPSPAHRVVRPAGTRR